MTLITGKNIYSPTSIPHKGHTNFLFDYVPLPFVIFEAKKKFKWLCICVTTVKCTNYNQEERIIRTFISSLVPEDPKSSSAHQRFIIILTHFFYVVWKKQLKTLFISQPLASFLNGSFGLCYTDPKRIPT